MHAGTRAGSVCQTVRRQRGEVVGWGSFGAAGGVGRACGAALVGFFAESDRILAALTLSLSV